MFTVYVLQSEASGRLYIGHTNDIERRLAEHQAGQTTSTRGRGPWRLLYTRAFPSRSEAMRYERWLKRMKSPSYVVDQISAR